MIIPEPENPPHVGVQSDKKGAFSIEDAIVTSTVFLGFGIGIVLSILRQPPALVALLLAAGVSALVHKFLGGLTGTEFLFGAFKLAGAVGALMTVFFVLNHYLVEQQMKPYEGTLAGPWRWSVIDKEHRWIANLSFEEPDKSTDRYRVTGMVRQADTGVVLYEITEGTAERTANGGLKLAWAVRDHLQHRTVTWETKTPLVAGIAFGGTFNPRYKGHLEPEPWGILLHRP